MTKENRDQIKYDIKSSNRVGFLFASIVGLLIQLGLIIDVLDIFLLESITASVIVFILCLTRQATRKKRKELLLDYKLVECHTIIDKTDYKDDDPGLGGWSHKYYIVANRNKHFVDKKFYDEVNISDNVVDSLFSYLQNNL